MIELGAFQIRSFIAAGGGGAVFRGQHVRSRMPTAIKTVFRSGRADPGVRLELEALAGLVHPHIVGIYDFGEVPEAFELGGITVPSGSIWIAMELGQQTLADAPPASWQEVLRATDQLLGALAHAHAHGVLHRDVKPANTLWAPGRTLKLSDFGVAVIDGQSHARTAGTLSYMAPEQAVGDFERLGPWTDLYAVGLTVWRWVCGEAPFVGRNPQQVLMKKIRELRAPFRPRFAVPAQLQDWLGICLRAAPTDRFEFAADALYALHALPRARGGVSYRGKLDAQDNTATVVSSSYGSSASILPASRHERPSPAPMTTASNPEEVLEVSLLDAGLELFGLRNTPLVGRDDEVRALWRMLADVRRRQRPKIAVLTGAPGLGRRSVARTLAERAHVRGAAGVLDLAMGQDRCHETLLQRFGGDVEAAAMAFGERFGEVLPGLSERIVAACEEGTDATEVLVEVLHRIASRRPLVLVIEEVQLGANALLDALQGLAAPVLVVATVPESAVATVPDRGQRLFRLAPLAEPAHQQVCRALLGLEPELGARLASLSEGNPGLAVQICDHWVQTDRLVPSTRGYGLKAGARATLPDSNWWTRRVADLSLDPADLAVARIAAHLGREVDLRHLALACSDGVELGAWVELLVRRRIISRTAQGFRWAHEAFQQAILALELPGATELASRAADALDGKDHRRTDRALCLVRAGRLEEAVPLLSAVITELDAQGHHLQVLPLWAVWEQVVATRPQALCEGVEIAYLKGLRGIGGRDRLTEALPRARGLVSQHGWSRLRLWTEVLELPLLGGPQRQGQITALLESMDEVHDPELQVEVLHGAALHANAVGRSMRAVGYHERAVEIGVAAGLEKTPFYRVALTQSLAGAGKADIAMAQVKQARQEALAQRRPFSVFFSWYVEGTLHFDGDDYQQAQVCFEEACGVGQRIGNHQEWYVRACCGICLVLLERTQDARTVLFRCLNAPTQAGHLFAHAGMLALEFDSDLFDGHWLFVQERWIDRGLADPIVAEILGAAADAQLDRGNRERARMLYQASGGQLERLGCDASSVRSLAKRL